VIADMLSSSRGGDTRDDLERGGWASRMAAIIDQGQGASGRCKIFGSR